MISFRITRVINKGLLCSRKQCMGERMLTENCDQRRRVNLPPLEIVFWDWPTLRVQRRSQHLSTDRRCRLVPSRYPQSNPLRIKPVGRTVSEICNPWPSKYHKTQTDIDYQQDGILLLQKQQTLQKRDKYDHRKNHHAERSPRPAPAVASKPTKETWTAKPTFLLPDFLVVEPELVPALEPPEVEPVAMVGSPAALLATPNK